MFWATFRQFWADFRHPPPATVLMPPVYGPDNKAIRMKFFEEVARKVFGKVFVKVFGKVPRRVSRNIFWE